MRAPGEWQGRPILDPKDADALDLDAAKHEFRGLSDRASAEEAAHRDYRRGHHVEAAAHHLRGVKAANASGDAEAAKKHGALYALHVKALGEDPYAEPPAAVKARAGADGKHDVYRFKAHKGDLFLLHQPTQKSEVKMDTREQLHELYKAAKVALEVLQKREGKEADMSHLNKLPPADAPKITSRGRAVGGQPAIGKDSKMAGQPPKPALKGEACEKCDGIPCKCVKKNELCKACGRRGELCKCSVAKSEPTTHSGRLEKSRAESRLRLREFFEGYSNPPGFEYEK